MLPIQLNQCVTADLIPHLLYLGKNVRHPDARYDSTENGRHTNSFIWPAKRLDNDSIL
ncbi:hypothetical protein DESC_800004 [Desulfosarcina cetonica]|nr:hypothetical protein DESC_800004 [Desulfosarcina cetonica]